ncbi:MAG: RluA family pseudouridine synthase [Eubacterium sp.]|nr:RluA family pseudouridine synthase [Eubacterium sp.]
MQYLEYYITKEDHGKEVLSILRGNLGLSITKIRSVKWDPAGILLDGVRVTVRQTVLEGQTLKVLKNDSENRQKRIIPCPMDLDILYEDEDLIFLNKPAGVVCHPSFGHREDSLANGLQDYFDQKQERSSIHLLGRLDKDTSGILGVAKNGVIARRMILDEAIRKEYIAITEGCLPGEEGIIDIPMEEYRDPIDSLLKMRRAETILPPESQEEYSSGNISCPKKAITRYKVVYQNDSNQAYSICQVWISTGRMHQIRFHMSQIGHPLLGDSIYGHGPTDIIARTALHAGKAEFNHPVTKKIIRLVAEMPEDMQVFCPRKSPRKSQEITNPSSY